jgi:sialic acid synthase SpsE
MKPIVIAEIAKEHEGSVQKAIDLANLAIEAGADKVKFQAYNIDDLNSEHPNFDRYKKCHLSIEQLFEVKKNIKSNAFSLSCFSIKLLPDIALFLTDIKIPSTFLCYEDFVYRAITLFHDIHISTGMFSSVRINSKLSDYTNFGNKSGKRVIPYHCVSQYPTKLSNARLSRLTYLNDPVLGLGYSDHTVGHSCLLIAACMGCTHLEKHFSLSKEKPWCFNAEDLKVFIDKLNNRIEILKDRDQTAQDKESFEFYKREFVGLSKWYDQNQ